MNARAWPLQYRIVIPFVLVAVVTASGAAFVSQALLKRALESRVLAQLIDASAVAARSEFALNGSILQSIKEITGDDVITFTSGGEIVASTIDASAQQPLIAAIFAAHRDAPSADDATVLREVACPDSPCYVAYRRVSNRPFTVVALVAHTSEIRSARRAITRTIAIAAALGLVALGVISQIVARRVTAPLAELVAFARNVSAGTSGTRARAGTDEIGRLAAAFNDMLNRLEQTREALIRSEKLGLAGLLAARVAHDIRNPLSSIKMQAQLLRTRVQGDESRAMLQSLLHDVDQIEVVIQGLLELASPGEVRLELQQVNDLLRDILDLLRPQFQHRKIQVELQLAAGIPALPLDSTRFKQAVRNVIANAVEAMPGGGTLRVSTRLVEDGSTLLLEIQDDGVGVDPVVLDRVFDPFVSTKREGVGLGLVNTKATVERHGGRIELAPHQPRGTRVTISLPTIAAATRASISPTNLNG